MNRRLWKIRREGFGGLNQLSRRARVGQHRVVRSQVRIVVPVGGAVQTLGGAAVSALPLNQQGHQNQDEGNLPAAQAIDPPRC